FNDLVQKRRLKTLPSEYLGLKIEDDPSGDDCIDARVCLQLVLLKMTTSVSRPSVPDQTLQQPVSKCQVSTNKSSGSLRFRPSAVTVNSAARIE
ncbi:hypothetical protein AVEN_116010-1, partial [Araneus ventricosus]